MRIIAGQYRGRKIIAPPGTETRPTLDRIRESLFNILGSRCADARILDLFAGSGALGLEAISRGAKYAVFCDISRVAALAISTNIASLGLDSTRIMQMDWQMALRQLAGEHAGFDIVFLDPPYRMSAGPPIEALSGAALLYENALLVLEHDHRVQPNLPETFFMTDQRHYGEKDISFITQMNGF